MNGKTVLYIPNEGFDLPTDAAAKNKDLVQRLESAYFLPYLDISLLKNCCDTLSALQKSEIEYALQPTRI